MLSVTQHLPAACLQATGDLIEAFDLICAAIDLRFDLRFTIYDLQNDLQFAFAFDSLFAICSM
jgi:hypothetical protein